MCLGCGVVRIRLLNLWVNAEYLSKHDKATRHSGPLLRAGLCQQQCYTFAFRFLSLPLALTALSRLISYVENKKYSLKFRTCRCIQRSLPMQFTCSSKKALHAIGIEFEDLKTRAGCHACVLEKLKYMCACFVKQL